MRFPLAWFDFMQAKCQANRNLPTKSHMRAVAHSLVTNHVGFAGGEGRGFLPRYVTLFIPPTVRECSRAERSCACCVWAAAAALISVYFSVLNSISFALQSVFFSCLSVLMHRAAGYGSWFSPTMCNARCTWVGLRPDYTHTTNEPHQSSFVSRLRSPLQGGLGLVVLICIWVWLLYSHQTKRTVLTRNPHQSPFLLDQTALVWKRPKCLSQTKYFVHQLILFWINYCKLL